MDLIDRNWADILRVAATMAAGTMRPSQIDPARARRKPVEWVGRSPGRRAAGLRLAGAAGRPRHPDHRPRPTWRRRGRSGCPRARPRRRREYGEMGALRLGRQVAAVGRAEWWGWSMAALASDPELAAAAE